MPHIRKYSIRLAIAAVVQIQLTGIATAQDLNPSEVFELTAPSVVIVEAVGPTEAQSAQGSGVVIERGLVITNCHVLKPGAGVRVRKDSKIFPAKVKARSDAEDLCLLSVADMSLRPARIRNSSSLKVGERVFAVGTPRGLELSLSDGLLSSIRRSKTGNLLQTTAPISPGSSGGGLFDSKGLLVGITTMFLKDSQSLNFAIPAERAARLRDEVDNKGSVDDPSSEVEIARAQLVEFDKYMIKHDPSYMSKRDELDKLVYKIRQTQPPARWLEETRSAYLALSEGDLTERVEKARAQLREYDSSMMENDSNYPAKRAALDKIVQEIRQTRPPEEWLGATKEAYRTLSGTPRSFGAREESTNARWVTIFQSEEQSIELDTRLELGKEGRLVGWTRWRYARPTTIGRDEGVKTSLNQWQFDCSGRQTALLSAVIYDRGSPPFSRTLTRRPIEAIRSVHVEAKEVQRGVQARRG